MAKRSTEYSWVDEDVGQQKFKYDIETWLSKSNHKEVFQGAFDGDKESLYWLPYWLALGLHSMKRKMK